MEKLCGPGTQLVDHGSASPRWTLDRGSAMASPELGLTAALGHSSSPTMAQRRERSTGSPSMASPGRGAMERREGEHGELRRRPVGHCPFIGGRGVGASWPTSMNRLEGIDYRSQEGVGVQLRSIDEGSRVKRGKSRSLGLHGTSVRESAVHMARATRRVGGGMSAGSGWRREGKGIRDWWAGSVGWLLDGLG
jgi:hypothetical protein